MKLANIIISEVQDDFEGGASLPVTWDNMLRRGVENVLDKIRPKTLNKNAPIFQGVVNGIPQYIAPDDILVPIGIFDHTGNKILNYYPPKQYREKLNVQDIFTLETLNGKTMIKMRKDLTNTKLRLDSTSSVASGDRDTSNFITDGFSKIFIVSDILTPGLSATLSSPTDYSTYLNETNPYYFRTCFYIDKDDLLNLNQVALVLTSSNGVNTDDDGTYTQYFSKSNLRAGWNYPRIALDGSGSTTGSFNKEYIISANVSYSATTAQEINLRLSGMYIEDSKFYTIQYVTTQAYVDGTTGAWKDDFVLESDYVNFDRDLWGILHYEICILVDQASTNRRMKGANQQINVFATNLKLKYQQYWEKFPSEEEPLSYSISPEISHSLMGMPNSYHMSDSDDLFGDSSL